MAHSAGIITAPVNTDDVSETVGLNSSDIGTLCSTALINKFAMWKPVRLAKRGDLTEADRRSVGFGIAFGYIASATSEAVNLLANLQTAVPAPPSWTYTRPRPLIDPTRITDFLNSNNDKAPGYNHNAKAPMSGFTDITLFESEFGSASKVYPFNFKYGPASYQGVNDTSGIEIPITELNSAITDGTWRLALLIYFPQSGKYKVAISAANSAISDTAHPGDMMVRPANSGEVAALYNAAWDAGVRELDAIPVLVKDLSRTSGTGSADRWVFQASSQIVSMPRGEKIKIYLSDRFANVALTFNTIKIEYLDIAGTVKRTYLMEPSGVGLADTQLAAPSASGSTRCRITLDFNLSGIMAGSDNVPKFLIRTGLSGVLVNASVSTLERTTDNGATWSSLSHITTLSGRYRITATDPQTSAMSSLVNMIEHLPRRTDYPSLMHIYPTVSLDGVKFMTSDYFNHHG